MEKIKLFYLIAFIGIIGCTKKPIEKVPNAKSTKELIQANEWIMTAYTIYPGLVISGDTITDLFSQIAECDKDGFMKFTNYDTIIYNNGILKCLPNEPKETYTRYIINNDSSITEYFPNHSVNYTILLLNEINLTYTIESNEQNIKRKNTLTFEKRK
jgi:hypothetical protein